MYTSGTTGDPKGVMLTHHNFISDISALYYHPLFEIMKKENPNSYLSYLPLAHSFERLSVNVYIALAGRIGFYQGQVTKLFEDIITLQPSLLAGVPRVWSRLYDKFQQTLEGKGTFKKFIFDWGYSSKREAVKNGDEAPFWDTMVFNETKSKIGGRVKCIVSGAAPLDPKLQEFLTICFCCPVVQGYGLTETCAGATLQVPADNEFGRVGPPMACVEIKLQDVPEMGYYSKDTPPKGEVLFRGGNVFVGYFKDEEKTKEVLQDDGWFHSGDVGRWNADGTLSIVDRKKNIFKLSQGEYVASEYLEAVYSRSRLAAQVFVYGNSLKTYLLGIVVPNFETGKQWAKEKGIENITNEELVANAEFKKAVMDSLSATGKEANLRGFEFLKNIRLEVNPFTVDNELMTPTFKLRRPNLTKKYKEELDRIYEEMGDLSKEK